MKVLHFKTHYLNISETFINRFIRNHKEFEPVIATCYPKCYTDEINIYSKPTDTFQNIWNTFFLKINKAPPFLYEVVKKEKPALIHGHFGLDSYRLIGLRDTFDLPLIVNFYGYDVLRLPKEFGWKQRYKKLAKKGDLFFVGSMDMKENVTDLGFPEDKVKILKLGLNIKNIRFQQRVKAGRNLMMVGRMVEKKGFKYAIQAIKNLNEQGEKFLLDLYGDGELRKDLESLVNELCLNDQITFHGQVNNEVIFEELYKHDLLLVPSVQARDGDREGIPQTTVEGMATGIPVIASDHAGLPELVIDHNTGLQVPQKDPEALSQAILTCFSNPDLVQKVSQNGRKKVEQEHDISKQVEKAEMWYKKLIKP